MAAESHIDPLGGGEVSYSYRDSSAQVWWNRIGVTSALFGICMSAAYLFGRPRP